MNTKSGPLTGVRVLEFAGIGPGPMCGMLLGDMGAEVLLLERTEPAGIGVQRPRRFDLMHRGKRSLAVDLKTVGGKALAAELVVAADVLVEGFRPCTMERLDLGPDVCIALQPALIYGRVTGYGQTGPLSRAAGHDLKYLDLSGALDAIGREGQPPTPPLNLLGDFAGGGMAPGSGIACALAERHRSGRGQVIDASMVEGASQLMTPIHGFYAAGIDLEPRGHNLLDGGAPFYDVYACADGRHLAFAAVEPKFRRVFCERAGLDRSALDSLDDPANWPAARALLTGLFKTRGRDDWCGLLEHSDACISPVLSHDELPVHCQHAARGSFAIVGGVRQPAPAPRLSRTPGAIAGPPPSRGEGGYALTRAWGVGEAVLRHALETGALRAPSSAAASSPSPT